MFDGTVPPMDAPRMTVGDHDLPVAVFGAGPPLVWGHGLTSSRGREDALPMVRFAKLAATHTIVRFDARGHGLAGGPPDPMAYAWPSLATDLLALADTLGFTSFVAAGVSMGTATALHAAIRSPQRIRAMVLTGPPTAWTTRAAQATTYRAGAALVQREGIAAYVAQLEPGLLTPPGTAVLAPDIPEDLLPHVFEGAALSDLPTPDALAALRIPTFIQAWAGDPGHPVSTAVGLHEALKGSELYVAEDLAGFKGWTTRIADFLRRVDA